jgi:hypothetical protein
MTTLHDLDRVQDTRRTVRVLVRGHKNQAFSARAIGLQYDVVVVAGASESPGIGYKCDDVFEWSDDLFDAITAASDDDTRRELWREATPVHPHELPQLA